MTPVSSGRDVVVMVAMRVSGARVGGSWRGGMSRGAPANMYDDRGRAPNRAYVAAPGGAPAHGRARRARPAGLNLWSVARLGGLASLVALQSTLLLVSLTPQTTWATLGLPDGPIPSSLSPLVAGLFFVLPAVTGAISRRWQVAIVLATFPAWLDLGIFSIAAAQRLSPFYIAQDPHAAGAVGLLELFAALGALGWLACWAFRLVMRDRAEATRT
jgi:hypothetical protein